MFDLEHSISDWRKQMLAAGIKTPVPLEELENHLREEIERQMKSGTNEQRAVEVAVQQIGSPKPIRMEFKKIDAENWNRPLVWAAWMLFAVSFVLPSFGGELAGWQCAGLSATAVSWPNFWGSWMNIHLAALTLANLLMIASPYLLPRLSKNARSRKWLYFSIFAALALTWSFLLIGIAAGGGKDLKLGCYVWAASFLLLSLSTLKIRNRKALNAAN